jgi:hypothetical protein
VGWGCRRAYQLYTRGVVKSFPLGLSVCRFGCPVIDFLHSLADTLLRLFDGLLDASAFKNFSGKLGYVTAKLHYDIKALFQIFHE